MSWVHSKTKSGRDFYFNAKTDSMRWGMSNPMAGLTNSFRKKKQPPPPPGKKKKKKKGDHGGYKEEIGDDPRPPPPPAHGRIKTGMEPMDVEEGSYEDEDSRRRERRQRRSRKDRRRSSGYGRQRNEGDDSDSDESIDYDAPSDPFKVCGQVSLLIMFLMLFLMILDVGGFSGVVEDAFGVDLPFNGENEDQNSRSVDGNGGDGDDDDSSNNGGGGNDDQRPPRTEFPTISPSGHSSEFPSSAPSSFFPSDAPSLPPSSSPPSSSPSSSPSSMPSVSPAPSAVPMWNLLVPVVLATPCRTDNRTNATLTRDCIVAGSLVGAGSVIRFAIVQVVSTTKITPPLRPRTRHRQLHLRHLRVRV